MKRICLFFLLCLFSAAGNAQITSEDTLQLNLSTSPGSIDLRPFLHALESDNPALTVAQVAALPFQQDTSIFHKGIRNNGRPHDLWLRLHLKNTNPVDTCLTLFIGWHDYLYWYRQDSYSQYTLVSQTGLMLDTDGVERWEHYGFPVEVPARTTCTYYLHIISKTYNESQLMPVLLNSVQYDKFCDQQLHAYRKEAMVVFILLGMLFVFLSIAIINYIQLPDRSYLFFAAYILGLVFFFALRLELKPFQLSFFYRWPMLKYYWDTAALVFCFYLMPMIFGNYFLNMRQRYPFMHRVFNAVALFSTLIIIVSLYCSARQLYHIPGIVFTYVYLCTLIPMLVIFIALARRSRHHPLVRFFLLGTLTFYVTSLASFIIQVRAYGWQSALGELPEPSNLLIAGILLQAMFFLAGLSYRNKLVHNERTKTQELLIKQLNKNKELQRKLNEQLEELVKEQTTEILRKKQELEEQRKLQLDIEYDKKLTEIELKAIRAQINPHFIFNCLNSIQLFVMQRDYEYAQKYLSDFSYLIRKTLDFSRRNFISLADEIMYLNTYLGLEKMRFENKMEYEIMVDPHIATAETEVPAMLLQPYVENAVKHGMINPAEPIGKLSIRFNLTSGDILECIIEDNGIGISRSKELRTLPKHHQSSGMEISFNRAELLNKMYNTGIYIEIIDKSVQNFQESGTIVKIFIPQL